MNRDLYITLVFSGGSPELSYIQNPNHKLQEYIDALEEDEYKEFNNKINKEFIENADNAIMGNLYRAQVALQTVGAEHTNYPKILKAYTELLKISAPVCERLSKFKIEASVFEDIELVI